MIKGEGHWWSATEYSIGYYYGVSMEYDTGGISGYYTDPKGQKNPVYRGGCGLSVRCIKD